MKKTVNIKTVLFSATFLATIFLVSSCDDSKSQDTKTIAEERNDEKFEKNKNEKDAQFLVNAAGINLKQIQLGQLAQKKGSSGHVQDLGKILESDHKKSQSDLTALAKRKNISIPTSPTKSSKDAYRDLEEKSGNDFDKAYADMMVNVHEDAIETFEDASEDCADKDIKNWAMNSLPKLRKHQDRAVECKEKCDNK